MLRSKYLYGTSSSLGTVYDRFAVLLIVMLFHCFLWISPFLAWIATEDVQPEREQLLKDTVSINNDPHSISNLAESIPGEPIADYPVHIKLQNIKFSCIGRALGHYYADPSKDCQVFHLCLSERDKVSFLCPVGSIFNQRHLVCDWWYNFDCTEAESLYFFDSEEYEREVTTPYYTSL